MHAQMSQAGITTESADNGPTTQENQFVTLTYSTPRRCRNCSRFGMARLVRCHEQTNMRRHQTFDVFSNLHAITFDATKKMGPEVRVASPLRFASHEFWIFLRMFAQEKRVSLKKNGTLFKRLALKRTRLRWMVDSDTAGKGDPSKFFRPPSEVGVLRERACLQRRHRSHQ